MLLPQGWEKKNGGFGSVKTEKNQRIVNQWGTHKRELRFCGKGRWRENRKIKRDGYRGSCIYHLLFFLSPKISHFCFVWRRRVMVKMDSFQGIIVWERSEGMKGSKERERMVCFSVLLVRLKFQRYPSHFQAFQILLKIEFDSPLRD